jgi:hypothetical protein
VEAQEIVQMSDRRYVRTSAGNLVYLDNMHAPKPAPQEPVTKFPVETGKAAIDSAIANLAPSEVNGEETQGNPDGSAVTVVDGGSNVLTAIGQEL